MSKELQRMLLESDDKNQRIEFENQYDSVKVLSNNSDSAQDISSSESEESENENWEKSHKVKEKPMKSSRRIFS